MKGSSRGVGTQQDGSADVVAPFPFTQSNVVAVPKSIAMDGPLNNSRRAKALRIRSAPT